MHSHEAMVFDPWNYLEWQNIEDSEFKNEYKSFLSIWFETIGNWKNSASIIKIDNQRLHSLERYIFTVKFKIKYCFTN